MSYRSLRNECGKIHFVACAQVERSMPGFRFKEPLRRTLAQNDRTKKVLSASSSACWCSTAVWVSVFKVLISFFLILLLLILLLVLVNGLKHLLTSAHSGLLNKIDVGGFNIKQVRGCQHLQTGWLVLLLLWILHACQAIRICLSL